MESQQLSRSAFSFQLNTCHPEAPSFGAEGPIGPSVRQKRGPQDDKKKGTAEAVPLQEVSTA
jgi:hypothetical protein